MGSQDRSTIWHRWVRKPQKVPLRRAVFKIHMWSGIGIGLYILFVSVTGSVLVYRNELYVAFTPEPIVSHDSSPLLSDDELTEGAERAYFGHRVTRIRRAPNPDQAVEIWLERGDQIRKRLFDARSGADVGTADPVGIWLVSRLIELHAEFLSGTTGRKVNALGATAVLVMVGTGLVIWWPGIRRWRRSLRPRRGVGWKRFVWDLHSTVGIWCAGFILVSGLSGLYLCLPEQFHALADRLWPPAENTGLRFVDSVLYWLAFLHFGRIDGIGIPCSGPGLCDQSIKALWAVLGLAPAAMFTTGTIMWVNRVLRPRRRAGRRRVS